MSAGEPKKPSNVRTALLLGGLAVAFYVAFFFAVSAR